MNSNIDLTDRQVFSASRFSSVVSEHLVDIWDLEVPFLTGSKSDRARKLENIIHYSEGSSCPRCGKSHRQYSDLYYFRFSGYWELCRECAIEGQVYDNQELWWRKSKKSIFDNVDVRVSYREHMTDIVKLDISTEWRLVTDRPKGDSNLNISISFNSIVNADIHPVFSDRDLVTQA